MVHDPAALYDDLADHYHLILRDFDPSAVQQATIIERVARVQGCDALSLRILDCTCGIGTQAIGLALRGHQVTATDISLRAVERARREAATRGVQLRADVADLRRLIEHVDGEFDLVISCDNALPYLLTDDELHAASRGFFARTRPGGVVLLSLRDYDTLAIARPVTTPPVLHEDALGRRVTFQVWRWSPDGRYYDFTLFLFQLGEPEWSVRQWHGRYRALKRAELMAALDAAGFKFISTHMPEDTGFYQPMVTARRP